MLVLRFLTHCQSSCQRVHHSSPSPLRDQILPENPYRLLRATRHRDPECSRVIGPHARNPQRRTTTKSVGFVRHPETITFAIPRIALVKPAIESKRWWHIYDSGYRQYNTLLEIDRHCTMSRATYCILYTVVYIYLYYIIY